MQNTLLIPQMVTIKEAAQKTGLANFYIRQLCLQNKIIFVKAGRKYLINFAKLIEFLNGNSELY